MERPTDMNDNQYNEFDDEFFLLINKYCRTDVDLSLCENVCNRIAELRSEAVELIDDWNSKEIE